MTELHILWETPSSHLKCEILGDINWSFTNVGRQRKLETLRITKQATEYHPTVSLPPHPSPQATATWPLPRVTVLQRVSGSVAAKTIFNLCTGWLNQRKTKKASQEARKKNGAYGSR